MDLDKNYACQVMSGPYTNTKVDAQRVGGLQEYQHKSTGILPLRIVLIGIET